ncbi:MAG: hypothetical protein K9M80_00395 [Candidatus Marinimicrobia bacterium]|nr:hypothetical protein [Candidatus Neomarinimicrobiota bacterium]
MDKNFKHYQIFSKYPWLNPENRYGPPYLVIGDDLDSLLSAALWNYVSDRDWQVIGVYHKYSEIFTCLQYWSDLDKAIWLDLDVNSFQIKSLGHHLILNRSSQHLPNNHCNLNYIANITCNDFQRKYPLGTIHFLMYLFDVEIPDRKFAREMIFSADSSWINGQAHRFPENVKYWIDNCIPLLSLKKSQKNLNTLEFEENMRDYFNHLQKHNIPQGKGQVTSKRLKLTGYQFQFNPANPQDIERRLALIQSITGWEPPQVHRLGQKILGTRKTSKISAINNFNLEKIMEDQDVFSYVFPHKGMINYTTGIKLNI